MGTQQETHVDLPCGDRRQKAVGLDARKAKGDAEFIGDVRALMAE